MTDHLSERTRWAIVAAFAIAMALFDRTRPDVVPHLVEVSSASFPSGHSMLSMTTYLTLGALLAEVQTERRFRIYVLAWAVALALLVGWSRVFLGVHWPTDVLAGWTAGAAWALLCWAVAQALHIGRDTEQ